MQESEQREEFPTFYPYKKFLNVDHSLRALEVRWRHVRGSTEERSELVEYVTKTLCARFVFVDANSNASLTYAERVITLA